MVEDPADLAKRRRAASRKPRVYDASRPPSLADRFNVPVRRTKRCRWDGCLRLISPAAKVCEFHQMAARRARATERRNAKSTQPMGLGQGPEGRS